MHRRIMLPVLLIMCGTLLSASAFLAASPPDVPAGIPTPVPLFTQPATVSAPLQADNGAQLYWGMCLDCHGEGGQGLSEDWRQVYPADLRDCWGSGCHGPDFTQGSFLIANTGPPALAGAGTLVKYANAFELQSFIIRNMPLHLPGALAGKDSWSLTAYLLRLNGIEPAGLELDASTAAAVPLHGAVSAPPSPLPSVLMLLAVLALAAWAWARRPAPQAAPARRANFVAHLHPARIPALQSRFRHTLAAGGLSVFFSIILLLTGLLEMYYYVPSPGGAPVSVQTITSLVPFGGVVRNLHFWSAQFLVIFVTLHLLRVVLTGAYAPPRRLNYLIGLGLLVVVLLLNFTGYVLRWDEGIRWALVVGANLLKTIPGIGDSLYGFVIGGSEPGLPTLTRFYTWHVFGLGVIALLLLIWHIFRLRRDGGIAAPAGGRTLISRRDLLRREILAMLITGVVLLFFSAFLPAPIDQPITSLSSLGSDTRAPWFFLWIQQMLKWGNAFTWGVLVPILVVVVLGLLAYLPPLPRPEDMGRWFPARNRVAQGIAVFIILAVFILTLLGALFR